ncbi:MAG TPA: hypothetical protein VJS15_09460 [Allosphingosinicella sp.]|nr:hypothetical protein [Allosphingosinicella sp.]
MKLLFQKAHIGRWNAPTRYGKPDQRDPAAIDESELRVIRPRILDKSD